jgi:Skp family chaperone for outer membrane proteins
MARKGGKGKPTRKEIDSAIQNLYQGLQYIGQKLEYLEGYAKSTETALDLYIKFKKDEKGFSERVKEFNKELEEKAKEQEKKVASEKETA